MGTRKEEQRVTEEPAQPGNPFIRMLPVPDPERWISVGQPVEPAKAPVSTPLEPVKVG